MATPEGRSNNLDVNSLKPLPKGEPGWSVKKPEEPKQQPTDAELETAKQLLGKHWRATVFEGPIRVPRPLPSNPSEQSGEAKPFQPNSEEQQAAGQRGEPSSEKAGSKAGPEHNPQLRELTKELFGDITDQGVSEFIAMAIHRYPELPPNEAVRKLDRDSRR